MSFPHDMKNWHAPRCEWTPVAIMDIAAAVVGLVIVVLILWFA